MHQVQDGSAQGGEVREQADVVRVPVVRHLVLPLGLDVGHAQGVADGLDRIGRRAVRGAKDGRHAQGELVTCWGWEQEVRARTRQLRLRVYDLQRFDFGYRVVAKPGS